jgi:CheY-like chemotaxis protein
MGHNRFASMQCILLADDSGHFRVVAEEIERKTRCRVVLAGSAADALAMARRERPDILFLDAEMAGMTGIDACRVLKADPHFAHTPIVVVSSGPVAAEDSRRAGADECLDKPCDETTISDSVRRHLLLFPRDGTRSPAGWPITFWRDGLQHNGTLRDLSRGGFFIATPVRQPIGARIEVSFEVPGEKSLTIVAEALVVRVGQDGSGGLGCRFFRVTASSRAALEECLRMLDAEETKPSPRRRDGRDNAKA